MTFLRRLVVLLLVVLGASMGRQAFAQKKIVQRVLRADSIMQTRYLHSVVLSPLLVPRLFLLLSGEISSGSNIFK